MRSRPGLETGVSHALSPPNFPYMVSSERSLGRAAQLARCSLWTHTVAPTVGKVYYTSMVELCLCYGGGVYLRHCHRHASYLNVRGIGVIVLWGCGWVDVLAHGRVPQNQPLFGIKWSAGRRRPKRKRNCFDCAVQSRRELCVAMWSVEGRGLRWPMS